MTSDQYSPYGAGKIAGTTEERERIIKLLEEASDCKCSPDYGIDYDNTCYCDALILIKGENK